MALRAVFGLARSGATRPLRRGGACAAARRRLAHNDHSPEAAGYRYPHRTPDGVNGVSMENQSLVALAQGAGLPTENVMQFKVRHIPRFERTTPEGNKHLKRNFCFVRPVVPVEGMEEGTDVFLHENDCVGSLPRKGEVLFAELAPETEGEGWRARNAWVTVDLTLHLCKELDETKGTIATMQEQIEALQNKGAAE